VRGGQIKQLTDDHSLVATMVREGLLTSQEAETHPRRNVLQRSMGVAEDVEIDVRGPFELREGDTFILCSDGLHGVVKEHELQEIAAGTIEEAADEFLRRALERGAPDNVTVIVARVEAADEITDELGERLEESPAGDARFEDTQPLDSLELTPLDAAPHHESVKETQKMKAVTPEELRDTDKLVAVSSNDETLRMNAPARKGSASGVAAPRPAPKAPQSTPVLRWTLVAVLAVVVALGAAGAWFYWHQQHTVSSPAR
jgi:hypothetical protein